MDPESLGIISKLDIRTEQYKDALRKYYRDNPEEEPKDWIKTLLEFGVPSAAGVGLRKVLPPIAGMAAAGAGMGLGTLASGLGYLGRSQRHVRDEGVHSNLLGYETRPLITDPNKKNFNY